MSKEPKSPKGEKADGSQKYWDKYFDLDMGFEAVLPETHKAPYDKLVSLEAKIEVLRAFMEGYANDESMPIHFLRTLKDGMLEADSEYQQLLKEHNL